VFQKPDKTIAKANALLYNRVQKRWRSEGTVYMSGQADISTLDQSVKALERGLGNRLVALVLFGSRARGEAREDSDWDLLVLAHNLPARPFRRHRLLKQMLPPAERGRISLLAKTPQEFEASLPALYLDIALDAVVLYDPDRYIADRLARLRQLINEKGLRRERTGRDLVWHWQEFPGFGWTVEWGEGRS
jgi:predicted nucleotidyltransferase